MVNRSNEKPPGNDQVLQAGSQVVKRPGGPHKLAFSDRGQQLHPQYCISFSKVSLQRKPLALYSSSHYTPLV